MLKGTPWAASPSVQGVHVCVCQSEPSPFQAQVFAWLPQWMKLVLLSHMAGGWREWKCNSHHPGQLPGRDVPSSPPLSTEQGPELWTPLLLPRVVVHPLSGNLCSWSEVTRLWLVPVASEPQERGGALLQVLLVGMLTKEHEEKGPSGKPQSLAVRLDKSVHVTIQFY